MNRLEMLFCEHTPIEEHRVSTFPVFVKRDDLFGQPPLPPLGKLRGLRRLIDNLVQSGIQLIGCWDTRISKLGQGVAVLAAQYPTLKAIVSYPEKPGSLPPESIRVAFSFGAELFPLRGNFPRIAFSQARRHVESRGGYMIPFGLECVEAVDAVASEAATVDATFYRAGTIVLCAGSGTTLAGILRGLQSSPTKIIALSSGRSIANIENTINRYVRTIPTFVKLLPAKVPYSYTAIGRCPFPCHPNYDLKAWTFLTDKIKGLPKPILFWNVGA